MSEHIKEKQVFFVEDRGFSGTAWYLKDSDKALVEITKDGKPTREFLYPAYAIWNVSAHFSDIVDEEIHGIEVKL